MLTVIEEPIIFLFQSLVKVVKQSLTDVFQKKII